MEGRSINLLLVEDNPGDAYLFEIALQEAGAGRFCLSRAENLAEAREILESGHFDIVMLDLSLPDSQGLDTVRQIMEANRKLPVVVLTGTEDQEIALQAVQLGAQDYLSKGSISSSNLVRSMLHAIERNRMKLELEELNENKNKLFSIISHDLRSPFYSLVQVVKHIVDNYDSIDRDTVKSHLSVIGTTTEKLYALVENLLQWAGSQTGRIEFRPSVLNVRSLTENVLTLLQEQASQKQISLQNQVDSEISVFADKHMIHTILRNLISNGIKFTRPGGAVKIAAHKAGDTAVMTVTDTGVGMSREKLEKLFYPEGRASRTGTAGERGTGLGLIICREFIQKNSGSIQASSRENEGTTFTITLPSKGPVTADPESEAVF